MPALATSHRPAQRPAVRPHRWKVLPARWPSRIASLRPSQMGERTNITYGALEGAAPAVSERNEG
jgi:hypothetical protein